MVWIDHGRLGVGITHISGGARYPVNEWFQTIWLCVGRTYDHVYRVQSDEDDPLHGQELFKPYGRTTPHIFPLQSNVYSGITINESGVGRVVGVNLG